VVTTKKKNCNRGTNDKQKSITARHWWLSPIILFTQEAEIRRIAIQNQPK
jgi:hypothetical protein